LEHGGEGLGGACSFTSATLVATARGEQAIGSLHVGEKVWAYNPKTHRMELEPILHVWINHDNDLVDLTLTTTKTDAHSKHTSKTSELIHTNKKHPFLTKEKGFLPVGQIKLGMHVLEANGQYGVVTGWKVVPGTKVMYNLEVAHDHTFVVGVEQWVVHNCNFAPGAEQHIFEGEINKRGLATGYHWEGTPGTPGEVIPGTETPPDARGVYQAQVRVSGVTKRGFSSFFPKSMTRQEVLDSIEEAYNNRLHITGNTYLGETSSGMVVQMFLNTADQIISAFPLYEPGFP
ncbi:MAG TPA: EndoU domain-containing protein, partial [Ktedonobacteraceae bacterium]|nr:EndoU domain-containing protein [Ktedonobacteraceae bacterium]